MVEDAGRRSHLIHRTWPPRSAIATSALGCTITTREGREFLDASSGALAVTIGYGVPEVIAAVREQAARMPFAHSGRFVTEVAEEAAADLAAVLPGAGDEALRRVLFTTGGSESVELAMALAYRVQAARGFPERRIVLARHLSYHGSTFATLDLGARTSLRSLAPISGAVAAHLPPPYPYRPEWHERFPGAVAGVAGVEGLDGLRLDGEQIARARSHPAAALEVTLEALGPHRVAAFVAEPVIGASAGAVVPDDDYWPKVREICDRHGVLWIADEVMSGMGRTGYWLASERWNVVPDIVALGKGLGAGYAPAGAVVAREAVWRAVADERPGFPFGFTFLQHPLAAAAARAVVRHIRERDLLGAARRIERVLGGALAAVVGEHPCCGEIRGMGAMFAVELVANRDTRDPFPRDVDATGRVLAAAAEHGVLFYPARGGHDGIGGDAFLVAPPLVATDDEIERIAAAVARALDTVLP